MLKPRRGGMSKRPTPDSGWSLSIVKYVGLYNPSVNRWNGIGSSFDSCSPTSMPK